MNPQLQEFIQTGKKPGSQKDTSALLDAARSELLSQTTKPNQIMTDSFINSLSEADIASIAASKTGTLDRLHTAYLAKQKPAARPAAKAPAPAPVATSKPAPVIHRAKPSTTAPSPTVTANDFATKPLVMRKSDFDSLTSADKSRFSVAGGRLI
jgi:hypothetical protein